MDILRGLTNRIGLAMNGKGPWGGNKGSGGAGSDGGSDAASGGSSGENPGSSGSEGNDKSGGPRNPWLPSGGDDARRSAKIEDIFKNRTPGGPQRGSGGGGGSGGPGFRMPQGPGGKSWAPIIALSMLAIWLAMSSAHLIGPKEKGVVQTIGIYSRTLDPGMNFTLPWPIELVAIENVSQIRAVQIPAGEEEKLILTGDQNLVNLSYLIRWNIKDLKKFKYELANPSETVEEVAEAAMRASVAEKTLDATFSGEGRAEIEERVRRRMQAVLDAYDSGVAVQGVQIDKTDPPARVVEAFKDVSAAQQDADAAINRSRATAQQILARAEGDTASFDKVYAQYRLAPEVTRRRLYYETMERVLSQTDKTIVETPGVTAYLPLPEIRKRTQQSGGTGISSATNPAQGQ